MTESELVPFSHNMIGFADSIVTVLLDLQSGTFTVNQVIMEAIISKYTLLVLQSGFRFHVSIFKLVSLICL